MARKEHPGSPMRCSKGAAYCISRRAVISARRRRRADIAVQICTQATMTKMIAYCTRGDESIDKANRLGGRRTRGRYARLNELYAGSGEKKAILRKIASNREI